MEYTVVPQHFKIPVPSVSFSLVRGLVYLLLKLRCRVFLRECDSKCNAFLRVERNLDIPCYESTLEVSCCMPVDSFFLVRHGMFV